MASWLLQGEVSLVLQVVMNTCFGSRLTSRPRGIVKHLITITNSTIRMKIFARQIALTATALAMVAGTNSTMAQDRGGRGNFDPEQMRERMTQMIRERLEITDDAEWKAIQPRIEKVMEVRRQQINAGGGFSFFGSFGGGPGGPGGRGGRGDAAQQDRGGRGDRGSRGGGFGREQNPAVEALQRAVENKASPEEIKQKLAALRAAKKEQEANLEKAQADLRMLLNTRQEAAAVLAGLLNP